MIIILHLIGTYLMFCWTIPFFKNYNVQVNIHSIPKFLLGLLIVLFLEYLCIVHFSHFIPVGIFFGCVLFMLQSLAPGGPSFLTKIMCFLTTILFWPEIFAVLMFHFIYAPKNEKSQS